MAKRPPIPLNVSELEQVKVLRASGLSFHAISKKVGRDHKTVKKACVEPHTAGEIKRIQGDLATSIEDVVKRLIVSISDEDIKRINVYQRIIAMAAGIDKMRLLRDQSTQNIALHEIIERIERKDGERRKAQKGKVRESLGDGKAP